MEAHLEILRLRATQTKNPLYVWDAIASCGTADFPRYPLPEWCLVYITTIASMLVTTANMKNTLTYPTKKKSELESAYRDRCDQWSKTANITSERTIALLPQILGFTDGKGKNFFFEYKKDQQLIFEAMIAEAGPIPLVNDPVKWVASRNNIEDRAARARIKAGIALLKPKQQT